MPFEQDIRVLIFLFLETLNGNGQTIEQKGMQEVLELEIELEEYLDTLQKECLEDSHWLQRQFFNDDEFKLNLGDKISKLKDPKFVSLVVKERAELSDIDLFIEKYPIGSHILPLFVGVAF